MFPRFYQGALCLICSIVLFASPTLALEKPGLHYILDASGSMWGQTEGKTKIALAKDVMTELIGEMPANIDAGLMVYGASKKGDCSDIKQVLPVGSMDKEKAISLIKGINPKGMTPIADSINQSVEQLRHREGNTTIVLVSDGIETCEKDPCTLTRTLKQNGIKFTMHVVGLSVQDDAEAQLRCIADAAGGSYFPAENAKELLSSLGSIQTSVATKKPIKRTEPKILKKRSSHTKTRKIKANKQATPGSVGLELASWVKKPTWWSLRDPESGKEIAVRYNSLNDLEVPAGLYQLAWRQNQFDNYSVYFPKLLDVQAGKKTSAIVDTGIKLNIPEWAQTPAVLSLRPLGQETLIAAYENTLDTQVITSGEYDVLVQAIRHRSKRIHMGKIKIEEGSVAEFSITSGLQPAPATWVSSDPGQWGLKDKDGNTIAFFEGEMIAQMVPTGRYTFFYQTRRHKTDLSDLGEVEVSANKLIEFPINTGIRIIPTKGKKFPPYIEYIRLDADGKKVKGISQRDLEAPMPLRPGRYKVIKRDTAFGENFTLVDSVEVEAGMLIDLEL